MRARRAAEAIEIRREIAMRFMPILSAGWSMFKERP
jgi:hypothetical protein